MSISLWLAIVFKSPWTEFHRTEPMCAVSMLSGSTRLLSVWQPSGTPEFNSDVLQAYILRADVISQE